MKRSLICDRCGGGSESSHPDARFCGPDCRVAQYHVDRKGTPERIHLRAAPQHWAMCTLKPVTMSDDPAVVTCKQCLRRISS